MLGRSVVAFSSDNGGPLDHANNWPRRGGKHTMYEGGLRTQAFLWASKGLLPEAARGSAFFNVPELFLQATAPRPAPSAPNNAACPSRTSGTTGRAPSDASPATTTARDNTR